MNHLKMHKIRISKNSWISGIVNPNFLRGYFKRKDKLFLFMKLWLMLREKLWNQIKYERIF